MIRIPFAFLPFLLFYSCKGPVRPHDAAIVHPSTDTFKKISIHTKPHPVPGDRFVITGDFDGDGKKEQLVEHYLSGIDNKETHKYCDSPSTYDDEVEMIHKNKAFSFALSDNSRVDTLKVSSNGKSFGLAYLKNEGDLDGDGADEISYVADWADWSSFNDWHIMTYKNKKWKILYAFSIWEWQLPYRSGEAEADFKGLVKKIKTNQIQIIYRNEIADLDTTIVDLRHPKPH